MIIFKGAFAQAFITLDYLGIEVLTGGRMYMSKKRKKKNHLT